MGSAKTRLDTLSRPEPTAKEYHTGRCDAGRVTAARKLCGFRDTEGQDGPLRAATRPSLRFGSRRGLQKARSVKKQKRNEGRAEDQAKNHDDLEKGPRQKRIPPS